MKYLITIIAFFMFGFTSAQEAQETISSPSNVIDTIYTEGDKIMVKGTDMFGAKVVVIYDRDTLRKIYTERNHKGEVMYATYCRKTGLILDKGITREENLVLQE